MTVTMTVTVTKNKVQCPSFSFAVHSSVSYIFYFIWLSLDFTFLCQYRLRKLKTVKFQHSSYQITDNSFFTSFAPFVLQKFEKRSNCSEYRDSPVSAVFWSPANRTIGKTALIEH